MALFVILAIADGTWQLLVFGAVDAAGAAWTYAMLRAEASTST